MKKTKLVLLILLVAFAAGTGGWLLRNVPSGHKVAGHSSVTEAALNKQGFTLHNAFSVVAGQ